jgi:hypothetical protein
MPALTVWMAARKSGWRSPRCIPTEQASTKVGFGIKPPLINERRDSLSRGKRFSGGWART